MTQISTMGTKSCATFALSGFLKRDFDINERYLDDPEGYNDEGAYEDIKKYYNDVHMSTAQPLGCTKIHPFSYLMEFIERPFVTSLKGKFIIATLTTHQLIYKDGYWANLLNKHGFKEVDRTRNSGDVINVIFTRNINRPSSYVAP
jgi:hypothetical protein